MTFQDAIKLIEDGKYNHLKIVDPEGKKIMELNAESSDSLIAQLDSYKQVLSTYGRIKFLAANESIFKQNWKDPFTWNVVFTNASPLTPVASIGSVPAGYVSANEAALAAQVESLKKQIEMDKRFSDLEQKIKEKDNEGIMQYLPMLGLAMDLPEKKLNSMLALGQIHGLMNGKTVPGLAGLGANGAMKTEAEWRDQVKPVVSGTDEEKKLIVTINTELEELCKKVEMANVAEFLKTLNAKPEFLATLINMAKNFNK